MELSKGVKKQLSKTALKEIQELKAGHATTDKTTLQDISAGGQGEGVVVRGGGGVASGGGGVASALASAASRSPKRTGGSPALATSSGSVQGLGPPPVPIYTAPNSPTTLGEKRSVQSESGLTPDAKVQATDDAMDTGVQPTTLFVEPQQRQQEPQQQEQQQQQQPLGGLTDRRILQHLYKNCVTKTELKQEVRQKVRAQVGPLKARVAQLKLENNASDANDPARSQVAFVGFSFTSAAERLRVMEEMVAQFRDFRATGYGHNYKGPLNNQQLTASSFVSFSDRKTAAAFLQAVKASGKSEFTVESTKIRVLPALTKLQRSRRWSLDQAEKELKKVAAGRKVEKVTRGERCVKVDNAVAFEQPQGTARGSFLGPFAHLSLPA